jgi:hypothetical protein
LMLELVMERLENQGRGFFFRQAAGRGIYRRG